MSRLPSAAVQGLLLGTIACAAPAARDAVVHGGRTPSGIAYDIAGDGPPIVFVHGAMLDRRQWAPQVELAGQFTVIRYDSRWHGESAGADTSFLASDDLLEVLDGVGVARASLVGLSNGARIAVDFALAHPDRVDRLVLASPGLGGYQSVERPEFWTPIMAALGAGDFAAAAAALADSPVMAVGAADSGWVAAMVRDQAGVFSQDPSREVQPEPPAIRRLAEIGIPTLVITGDADLRDILLTGDTLAAGIPGARRLVISGARHLLNITHAKEFNRIVSEFLAAGVPR